MPPITTPDVTLDESIASALPGDFAYFGAGTFSPQQVEHMTEDTSALAAEIEASMLLMGELSESPCKVESKSSKLRTRNFSFDLSRSTSIEITLAGLSPAQKDYLESPEFTASNMCIAIVSAAFDRLLLFNGLRFIPTWSGESDGLFTTIISTELTAATRDKV